MADDIVVNIWTLMHGSKFSLCGHMKIRTHSLSKSPLLRTCTLLPFVYSNRLDGKLPVVWFWDRRTRGLASTILPFSCDVAVDDVPSFSGVTVDGGGSLMLFNALHKCGCCLILNRFLNTSGLKYMPVHLSASNVNAGLHLLFGIFNFTLGM